MSGKPITVKLESGRNDSSCNDLCRLCLVKGNDESLLDIFDYSSEISISVRIMACAGFEVTQHDSLPKRICLKCRYQLEKSFLFRNKCKNSDNKLRRHFRFINAGKVSHEFDDSDDDGEEEYEESNRILADFDKTNKLASNIRDTDAFKQALSEAIEREKDRIIQMETERIYKEAKDNFEQQYQHNNKDILNVSPAKITTIIKKRNNKGPESEFIVEYNQSDEEFVEDEEMIVDTIDANDEDEIDESHVVYMNEHEDTFEAKYDTNELKASQSNYMVLETGDVTLAEDGEYYDGEMSDDDDNAAYAQNEEYLEEDFDDEPLDNYEQLLPTIKKTICLKAGLKLSKDTKYQITKKPGKLIEVQCTTSDGNVVYVEMEDNRTVVDKTVPVDENGELKIFSCKQCTETFSRRAQLLSHASEHKEKTRGMKCSYCQKWFPSNSTLKRHIRVHTGEKPFKCEVCDRSFIQKEILKRHLMIHTGERPNRCDYCDKTFILKETLRQHINRNHLENPVVSSHNCPLCPKKFCHSSGLSRHLLVHAGRTFNCDFCQKKFNDRSALKRHTATIHKDLSTHQLSEVKYKV